MKIGSFIPSIFVLTLVVSLNIRAQENVNYGRMTKYGNSPYTGAPVQVKSTTQDVLTDSPGDFAVVCNSDDKLKAFAHGIFKEKVKLEPKTKFAVLIGVDEVSSESSSLYLIPPLDLKDVDVIKDATSAIYIAQGAIGVVIIETRHGSNNRA